ncbi:MAG: hypothetical protein II180_09755 [Proteobacteria bacterium]|nr:hypothetical protein [Pseudomonadota bacterium]
MCRALGRCAGAMLAALAFVLSAGGGMADELCHYKVQDLSKRGMPVVMLSKVEYAYAVIYDEGCRIDVVQDDRDGVECSRPQVDMRPGAMTTQVESHVSLGCQYRRPGYYYSAPVHFELSNLATGQRQAIYLPREAFQVENVASEARLESRLTFRTWKNRPNPWLWGLVGVVAVGLAALVGWRFRHKETVVPEERLPELAPLEEFWMEIRVLSEIEPTTATEICAYYDRLSIALRRLIGRELGVDCLSDTTSELFDRLKVLGMPPAVCMETRSLLDLADLVKFAKETPEQAKNLMMLRDAGYLAARFDVLCNKVHADEAETSGLAADASAEEIPLDASQLEHVAELVHPSQEAR